MLILFYVLLFAAGMTWKHHLAFSIVLLVLGGAAIWNHVNIRHSRGVNIFFASLGFMFLILVMVAL